MRVEENGDGGSAVFMAATAASAPPGRQPPQEGARAGLESWMLLLRPQQWVKNGFVIAPLLFSGRAGIREAAWSAALAFIAFCLLTSGGYVINDILDRASDRAHPLKRSRPIAAGTIDVSRAMILAVALIISSIVLGWFVAPAVGGIALAYLVLSLLYSLWLKAIVIVDVFAIASFFILRLLAGAAAIDVRPSVWLLLCSGLLALYLGFAKRRHELVLLGQRSSSHRAVLSQYTTPFLDQLSAVLLSLTVTSYIMYTLTSDTARTVGSEALAYSSVFVLFGVLRYLYLVHRIEGGGGGNPAETLLTDKALLTSVVFWALYCAYVIYLRTPP